MGIQNSFYFFSIFFQSSLDRGCFSCECLLISENQEGLQFWRRRVGSEKIDRLLEDQQNSRQELFIELSKTEMSTFYQQTDPELWTQISKANLIWRQPIISSSKTKEISNCDLKLFLDIKEFLIHLLILVLFFIIDIKNLSMSFCTIFRYVIFGWYHNNLEWKYCLLFLTEKKTLFWTNKKFV